MENPITELIQFQINRNVRTLFKRYLILLEDLRDEGVRIPDDKFQKARKRILDAGNDCLRELESILEKVDVTLKIYHEVDNRGEAQSPKHADGP